LTAFESDREAGGYEFIVRQGGCAHESDRETSGFESDKRLAVLSQTEWLVLMSQTEGWRF
jgi:hypothetical protein